MKVRAKAEFPVLVDECFNVKAYIKVGEEFEVFPTKNGMRFEAFGKLISPYDVIGHFELIE